MIHAIIDLGSNSIRLSVYEISGESWSRLYSGKRMAGLASYVEKGVLSQEGISRACEVLRDFRVQLENSVVESVSVFATASLRNVKNTAEATGIIEEATGYPIEVLSGSDEAVLGYYGARPDCDSDSGILVDIGGGSTELVFFEAGKAEKAQSLPIGSLELYARSVSKFLPKSKELARMKEQIRSVLEKAGIDNYPHREKLYGIGGTSRAAAKLANRRFLLDSSNRTISSAQLTELRRLLCDGGDEARSLILRTCPERVHTIVPGLLILDSIVRKTQTEKRPSVLTGSGRAICASGLSRSSSKKTGRIS